MQKLKSQLTQLGVLLLAAIILTACSAGLSGKPTDAGSAPQAPAAGPKPVEQDPALRITTAEVMDLFKEVYGDRVLIKATLDTNNRFLLVDARPLVRYQEGHVPGAIHMLPGDVAANIDKLPRDRQIIFYCGGLHCPLSGRAAKAAMEHGLPDVKVWYEGDPGWIDAGNYLISTTPYVYHMVGQADKQNFVLIDSRPSQVYRKSFIPGALSIPTNQWEFKKSLLPRDLDTRLIFYCGGHGCPHSHNSAIQAKELGYRWVSVYSAGEPEWKQHGLPLWGNEPSGVVEAPVDLPTAPGGLPRAINAEEFRKLLAEKADEIAILDVRSVDEFAAGHLPGAVNIPDDRFHADYDNLIGKVPTGKRVIIHCITAVRAEGVYHAIATRGKYNNPKGIQFLNAAIGIDADGKFTLR